jgi:dephospho-CoA kinase
VIAREVVEPGKPALKEILRLFGSAVLSSDGSLDRKKMRQLVFDNPVVRKKLEAILHPLISKEAERLVARADGPYCILVIPLYSQASSYKNVDRVLVVDVSEEAQVKRIMERDGSNRELARKIIAAQPSRTKRLALSDDVIINDGSQTALEEHVALLHKQYLLMSAATKTK